MPLAYLGLEPSTDPLRFRLPVSDRLVTPGRFLFGGAALGACVEALESATGRPLVWATAQYLNYALAGSTMDIEVTLAVTGHQSSQARAVGRVGDTEILTVNAALGRRSLEAEGQWAIRPNVPGPEQCARRTFPMERMQATIHEHLEVRLAHGRPFDQLDGVPGDGRYAVWVRIPGVPGGTAVALAIHGDHVPGGVGQALGRPGGGNSLDNTLRVAALVPTEWVLCDIRVHAVHAGFAHGLAHLWAEDGTLLATASQSVIVRFWPGQVPEPKA